VLTGPGIARLRAVRTSVRLPAGRSIQRVDRRSSSRDEVSALVVV